jgi:hypothetical protein
MSDHTPLLLQGELVHYRNPSFHFENFWVHVDSFTELVQQVWNRPVHSALPLKRLNTKLARVARGIKRWRRGHMATVSHRQRGASTARSGARN